MALEVATTEFIFAQDTYTFSLAVLLRSFKTDPSLLRHSNFSYAQQIKPQRPIVWEYPARLSKLG
jgi:hypothetical protein